MFGLYITNSLYLYRINVTNLRIKMELQEIRKKLRPKDYALIAEKLKGLYTENTIRKQLTGKRTLKDPVRDAAIELIGMREKYVND